MLCRMPDHQRYQVFVSSTFLDLRDERQAVIAALLECEAFPAGMELFPAADDDAWTLIKKVIDECDYYLLVIGGKYGSVDPEDDLSFTEKEYDYAVQQSKPVMAFIHGSPTDLLVSKAELDPDKREKLQAFRDKVTSKKHVKYWTSAEGLAGQVALTYNKFVRLYDAVGWVRADQAVVSQEIVAELAAARLELDRSRSQRELNTMDALNELEELSQGEDKFDLSVSVRASYTDATGQLEFDTFWVRLPTEWNTVLRAIGPKMYDECDEESIRTALTNSLWAYAQDQLIHLYAKQIGEGGGSTPSEVPEVNLRTLLVDDEDLGNILTQFKALGLIEKSIRKRSVSDTKTYWTLTERGDAATVKLCARKRPSREAEGSS